LGNVCVLAEETLEITPCGSDGIGTAAGQKMKERFFFDGVHMARDDLAIYKAEKRASPVFSDPADSR
jgi:hypothetical protein